MTHTVTAVRYRIGRNIGWNIFYSSLYFNKGLRMQIVLSISLKYIMAVMNIIVIKLFISWENRVMKFNLIGLRQTSIIINPFQRNDAIVEKKTVQVATWSTRKPVESYEARSHRILDNYIHTLFYLRPAPHKTMLSCGLADNFLSFWDNSDLTTSKKRLGNRKSKTTYYSLNNKIRGLILTTSAINLNLKNGGKQATGKNISALNNALALSFCTNNKKLGNFKNINWNNFATKDLREVFLNLFKNVYNINAWIKTRDNFMTHHYTNLDKVFKKEMRDVIKISLIEASRKLTFLNVGYEKTHTKLLLLISDLIWCAEKLHFNNEKQRRLKKYFVLKIIFYWLARFNFIFFGIFNSKLLKKFLYLTLAYNKLGRARIRNRSTAARRYSRAVFRFNYFKFKKTAEEELSKKFLIKKLTKTLYKAPLFKKSSSLLLVENNTPLSSHNIIGRKKKFSRGLLAVIKLLASTFKEDVITGSVVGKTNKIWTIKEALLKNLLSQIRFTIKKKFLTKKKGIFAAQQLPFIAVFTLMKKSFDKKIGSTYYNWNSDTFSGAGVDKIAANKKKSSWLLDKEGFMDLQNQLSYLFNFEIRLNFFSAAAVFSDKKSINFLTTMSANFKKVYKGRQVAATLKFGYFFTHLALCFRSPDLITNFLSDALERRRDHYTIVGAFSKLIVHFKLADYNLIGFRLGFYGRLNGRDRKFRYYITRGVSPRFRTLDLKVDYAEEQCVAVYGVVHIHAWLYRF